MATSSPAWRSRSTPWRLWVRAPRRQMACMGGNASRRDCVRGKLRPHCDEEAESPPQRCSLSCPSGRLCYRARVNARVIGRYLLCDELAAGGMASVHFGLLLGDEGFTKTVAIKRLHPQFAKDP